MTNRKKLWPPPGHLNGCETVQVIASKRTARTVRVVTRRGTYWRVLHVRPDGSTFVILPRIRGFSAITPVAREAGRFQVRYRPLVEVGP